MEKDPTIGSGCWNLGIIYINPADKRIMVRKRSSLGWTFNFARPLAIPALILTCVYALTPFYLLERFEIEPPWALVAAFIFVLTTLMGFCFWMEKAKA